MDGKSLPSYCEKRLYTVIAINVPFDIPGSKQANMSVENSICADVSTAVKTIRIWSMGVLGSN